MNYKALICDVDGTFVVNKREALPTTKVISAVANAKEKVVVSLATGRFITHAREIIAAAGITDPCIVCGGAQVVDPTNNKVLWEQVIDQGDVEKIFTIIDDQNLMNYLLKGDGVTNSQGREPMDHLLQFDAMGIAKEQADGLILSLSRIPNIVAHAVPSWTAGKVDVLISHAMAAKQHGIFELSKILGIETHRMIGVGDGGNDFPLLMACGLKVAMGNASDELKAIADYIAPSVEDDGVADVIEKFILSH